MAEVKDRPVVDALRRLRRSATVCCVIVGASLVAQLAIWSLVMFTELRYKTIMPETPELVVTPESKMAPLVAVGMEPIERVTPGPIEILSRYDIFFQDVTSVALASGTMALLVLILLVVVTVVVVSAVSAPGVNEAVSTMIWVVIVAVLTLPISRVFDLPFPGTALRSYSKMVSQVEYTRATGAELSDYAGFLVMPASCLAGLVLIAWRFGVATAKGLPSPQPFLDPELENEASQMEATSLHGVRGSGALSRVVEASEEKRHREAVAAQEGKRIPSLREVSAGERPRRPI